MFVLQECWRKVKIMKNSTLNKRKIELKKNKLNKTSNMNQSK